MDSRRRRNQKFVILSAVLSVLTPLLSWRIALLLSHRGELGFAYLSLTPVYLFLLLGSVALFIPITLTKTEPPETLEATVETLAAKAHITPPKLQFFKWKRGAKLRLTSSIESEFALFGNARMIEAVDFAYNSLSEADIRFRVALALNLSERETNRSDWTDTWFMFISTQLISFLGCFTPWVAVALMLLVLVFIVGESGRSKQKRIVRAAMAGVRLTKEADPALRLLRQYFEREPDPTLTVRIYEAAASHENASPSEL